MEQEINELLEYYMAKQPEVYNALMYHLGLVGMIEVIKEANKKEIITDYENDVLDGLIVYIKQNDGTLKRII